MRWRRFGWCAVAALGLGCGETYGIRGSIDDAMEKDIHAQFDKTDDYVCPSDEEVKRRCVNPKSEQCPKKCR
jgi:hypothetical protein